MSAKVISLSPDDGSYYVLPGSQGELTRDGVAIEDTIFGQSFQSQFTGIISWALNANAVYKGYPGYGAKLLKQGSSTAMNGEAMTLVSGKTYQITDAAKRIINRAVPVVVEDNAVDHTDDVESIDFLFGKVTFKAAYTPTGPITITGEYFPTASLAKFMNFNLTQTCNAVRNTDGPTAQANNGHNTYQCGLRQVSLELSNVYDAAPDWPAALATRGEYVIEVNPDGLGPLGSRARGLFRLMSDRQAGNVGELEEESLNFSLNVPIQATGPALATPYAWEHHANSPIPRAVKEALDKWEAQELIYVKYLHDGTNGWKGQGVLTNISLAGGMETANTFTVSLQGSGALTAQP